jgi:hypothetical protein
MQLCDDGSLMNLIVTLYDFRTSRQCTLLAAFLGATPCSSLQVPPYSGLNELGLYTSLVVGSSETLGPDGYAFAGCKGWARKRRRLGAASTTIQLTAKTSAVHQGLVLRPPCLNTPCQFTPLLNLRSFIFRFIALWLVYFHLFNPFYGNIIFTYPHFLFTPTFSKMQLGRKTRTWCNMSIKIRYTQRVISRLSPLEK